MLTIVVLALFTVLSAGALITCMRERKRLEANVENKDSSFWDNYTWGWIAAVSWSIFTLSSWIKLILGLVRQH